MSGIRVAPVPAAEARCVLPIGSTEPHLYLSPGSDVLLAEGVAVEAAAPLQVPVFPSLAYGFTPSLSAYPARASLRLAPFLALLRERIASLRAEGYRRIVVVNGHGCHASFAALASELTSDLPGLQLKLHHWRSAPRTAACARELAADGKAPGWPEADLQELWRVGVAETRAQIEGPWP